MLHHAPVARPPPAGSQFMPLEVLQQYAAQSGLQLSPMPAPLGSPWQQHHLQAGHALQQQAHHQGYQVGQGPQWLAGGHTPPGHCSRVADGLGSFSSPAGSAPLSYAQGTREEGGVQAHGTPSSLAEPRPSPVAWDIMSAHQQQWEAGASHQPESGAGHAAGMDEGGTRADLHSSADSQEGDLQEHFELREAATGLGGRRLPVSLQDGAEARQGADSLQEEALPASDGHSRVSPSLPQRHSSPADVSGTTRQARGLARTLTQAAPAEGGTGGPLHTGCSTLASPVLYWACWIEMSAAEVQQPSQKRACSLQLPCCTAPLHPLEWWGQLLQGPLGRCRLMRRCLLRHPRWAAPSRAWLRPRRCGRQSCATLPQAGQSPLAAASPSTLHRSSQTSGAAPQAAGASGHSGSQRPPAAARRWLGQAGQQTRQGRQGAAAQAHRGLRQPSARQSRRMLPRPQRWRLCTSQWTLPWTGRRRSCRQAEACAGWAAMKVSGCHADRPLHWLDYPAPSIAASRVLILCTC